MSKKNETSVSKLDRRTFLAYFTSIGLSSTLLPGILWARLEEEKALTVNKKMLAEAEKLAGLEFTDSERDLMLEGLQDLKENYDEIRKVSIHNSVAPALHFKPFPVSQNTGKKSELNWQPPKVRRPNNLEDVAFWPVVRLSGLIKNRLVTSTELTKMYISRLKKYNEKLKCVVTLTEGLALKLAKRADEEIAAGKYRGPLHGIPWGAKDLLSVIGYPTTWGAKPYENQVIDTDATVVQKLEEAGAVLVAKLALGALAWGDVWFGGKTKNPWNMAEGSSGSSAGPGAATAAGLVGFSIGSETWGSIVSPSTVCGVSGLRPTYGHVSRYGAMAVSWSMDKLGPMCRSAEDCALVLEAIHGADGLDLSAEDRPFSWNSKVDLSKLKIGYLHKNFDEKRKDEDLWRKHDLKTLDVLSALGANLQPIELPDLPVRALSFILSAEAGAAFDDLTRNNRDDLLVRQIENAWPNVFRQSRMIPAVEYIQANRVRTKIMQQMSDLMSRVDVYITPSWVGDSLLLTNLTGHPQVVIPNGFRENGTPTSISFVGNLFRDEQALAVAKTYQGATDFHLRKLG